MGHFGLSRHENVQRMCNDGLASIGLAEGIHLVKLAQMMA
jgi:hypothetical protein